MKKHFLFLSILSVASLFAQTPQQTHEELVCAEGKAAANKIAFKSNPNTLNYDVIHHNLEFTVDPAVLFIAGKVTTTYKAVFNLDTLIFDLSSALTVSTVKKNGVLLSFSQNANNELVILMPATQTAGTIASVEITYSGAPVSTGFGSFNINTHAGAPIMWTLSEPFGARDWWPCKQDLNDKADSIDVYITAPSQFVSVANGIEPAAPIISGTQKTTHFKHKYPIPAYLIAMAVSNYSVQNQTAGIAPNQFPVINYMYPESLSTNLPKIVQTPLILTLFDSLITPYPFLLEKYGHAQFGWGGGMEHTTVTFLVNFDRGLIAHELAHQWFGDNITCGTWKDIWLNESFATYFASLVIENFDGNAAFVVDKTNMVNNITSEPDGAVYLTDAEATNVGRIFSGRLSYYKGAMVLNMLRLKMGTADFFQGIKNYLNDTTLNYGYAVTPDFQSHMELVYGQPLTEFFNDWIYDQGYPSYNVAAYNAGPGLAHVTINQTQSHPSVSFFEMPVPIRFLGAGGQQFDTILDNTVNGQSFYINVPFPVTGVVFDPNVELISKNNTTSLGIETASFHREMRVFPNPVSDVLNINLPSGINLKKAIVFNNLGQNLGSFQTLKIPVLALTNGVYVLQVETDSGIFYQKFVKH